MEIYKFWYITSNSNILLYKNNTSIININNYERNRN